MSNLGARLEEDRLLRDAALRLLKADVAFIRSDLKARSVPGRIADRLEDSALDIVDEAVDYALDHKGKVATIIAAIILWFTREPLLEGLSGVFGEDEEDQPEHDREEVPERKRSEQERRRGRSKSR